MESAAPFPRSFSQGGQQEVEYQLRGARGALAVSADGTVTLRGALDRESSDGGVVVAEVLAVDRGSPPLTASATLTVVISDVNDCPPTLATPTVIHVQEHARTPALLATLTADDEDVWALGHGPPFNLSLAPGNPAHVLDKVDLKFNPYLDSGRGGAEVWLVSSADREEHRTLQVGVTVSDAGGLAATYFLTLIVDDLNDHPMKPASKTVYLWKTQDGGSDAPSAACTCGGPRRLGPAGQGLPVEGGAAPALLARRGLGGPLRLRSGTTWPSP
ncbi:At-cadherin [Penaeus vannamei]|uniref:At-cadherin n=1 Tax=Penaeus vannamei TaxID=6689 RepID=A0A3R7PZQ3_PENVA|nr:At-cadherin [Penaeus vannamei]